MEAVRDDVAAHVGGAVVLPRSSSWRFPSWSSSCPTAAIIVAWSSPSFRG